MAEQDEEECKDDLFDLPEGFIGWTGNINNPVPMFKMYGSRLSTEFVAREYGRYASSVVVEALTIHPKRAGETIKDVFFKTNRNFSYYYQHEEFTISTTPLDSSLAEFLNFATDVECMYSHRNHVQQLFLREFVGSYKGFHSGREMNFGKHNVVIDEWEGMDKSHLIHLGLALSGAKNTLIYEEVGISGLATSSTLPHGKIDLLALSQKGKSSRAAVAIRFYMNRKPASGKCSRITATTVKTQHTYDTPGSDRQTIVELLALSQVLLESNPDIRCCIMIKAMRHVFKPYFYLPQVDMLIRIGCDIKLDDDVNGVMGSFILLLIMHHHFNYTHFMKLADSQRVLGWAESYKTCGSKYDPYIMPQKYSRRISVPIEPQEGEPRRKRLAMSDYSEFDSE